MDHARRFAPRCLVVAALLALPALPAFASRPAPTPPPAASDGRWFDRGMELHEDEKWDEAIAAFRRAIDAGERVGVSSFNVACAYARKGEKDLAFEWLGRAEAAGFELRRHLDDRDLDSLRTDSRFTALKAKARSARSGRSGEKCRAAVVRFDQLDGRGAKDGRALFDVGQDLLACNELDRAARAFLAAAEAGRREGTSLYNAACARALESRNAEALDLLERAVAAGFDGAGHLRRDDDLDGLRAEPRFERIAKDAEALSLGDFPSLGARLLRSQMVTEADEAAARFEAFLRTNPRSGRAWWSIGKVRLTAGQDREAVHAFTRALSLGYRRGATAYDLACAHARLKERDAAFARLFEAIDLGAATADHVEEDDDLWNLRRDPRFEEAVARARRVRGTR
ncbi:MAG: hypothetical protein KBB14_12340 [Thermoanaerobaculia bacterium]|nr:hypothetical protein [Thermoanaerobaculia bacterium]